MSNILLRILLLFIKNWKKFEIEFADFCYVFPKWSDMFSLFRLRISSEKKSVDISVLPASSSAVNMLQPNFQSLSLASVLKNVECSI